MEARVPRSAAPQWRQRKQPVLDDYVMASIEQAGGQGHHNPETGHYAELIIRGLTSREEAGEYVRGLNRAALWLHRNRGAEIGMSAKAEKAADGYRVRFKAIDKTTARAHVLAKYGPDRTKWPYDPRRRIS
jgi:hypothetical protein